MSDRTSKAIRQAAELIGRANTLLVTVGVGVGLDSGLATICGKEGFWRSYRALKHRRFTAEPIAQASWLVEDPVTA